MMLQTCFLLWSGAQKSFGPTVWCLEVPGKLEKIVEPLAIRNPQLVAFTWLEMDYL